MRGDGHYRAATLLARLRHSGAFAAEIEKQRPGRAQAVASGTLCAPRQSPVSGSGRMKAGDHVTGRSPIIRTSPVDRLE